MRPYISAVGALLCFLLLYSGLLYLQSPGVFPIRSVQVRGPFLHIPSSRIKKDVSLYFPASFFGLSLQALETGLLAEEPWLSKVAIRRRWPDTIRIQFVERHPIARWNAKALVAYGGVLFYPSDQPLQGEWIKGLPILEGDEKDFARVLRMYDGIMVALKSTHFTIKTLSAGKWEGWRLRIAEKEQTLLVKLGEDDAQGIRQLERFLRNYGQLMRGKSQLPKQVDLRYPNAFSVQWHDHKIVRK